MGCLVRFIWGVVLGSICSLQLAHAASFNSDFSKTTEKVRSSLIHAPEASEIYLNYWIDVYNAHADDYDRPQITLKSSNLEIKDTPVELPSSDNLWKPNGYPIVSPDWGQRVPVSFAKPSDFRPPAPPNKTDGTFEADIEEVFQLGEKYGEYRDADLSVAAAFWADGLGTVTPPGRWNLIALQETQHLPEFERIQILTALNIALYDAGIAAWDSKYYYKYWRPTTAISAQYPEHIDWEPMLAPPFHPEYVSGHSTFSGAAATILSTFLGDRCFCVSSEELLGLERCFSSFDAAADEAGRSRIYGGIHFEFSNQAGLELGKKVADQVLIAYPKHFSKIRSQAK